MSAGVFDLSTMSAADAPIAPELAGAKAVLIEGGKVAGWLGKAPDLPDFALAAIAKHAGTDGTFVIVSAALPKGDPAPVVNPWKPGRGFSVTEQMDIVRRSPELAAKLKAEAKA